MRKFTGPPNYPSSGPPTYGPFLPSPPAPHQQPPLPPPPLPPSSSSSSSAGTIPTTTTNNTTVIMHPSPHPTGIPVTMSQTSVPALLSSPIAQQPPKPNHPPPTHTVNISVELKKYEKLVFPTNSTNPSLTSSSMNPPPFALIIDERTGQVSRTVQLINNNTAALVTPVNPNTNGHTSSSTHPNSASTASSTVYYSQPTMPRFTAVTNNPTLIAAPSGPTANMYPPTVAIPSSSSSSPYPTDTNGNSIVPSPPSSTTITYYTTNGPVSAPPTSHQPPSHPTYSSSIPNNNVTPSYYTVDNNGNFVPVTVLYNTNTTNGVPPSQPYPVTIASSTSHAAPSSYYSTASLPSSAANTPTSNTSQPMYFTPVVMNSLYSQPQQPSPPLPPPSNTTVYSPSSNHDGSRSTKSSHSQHSNPHLHKPQQQHQELSASSSSSSPSSSSNRLRNGKDNASSVSTLSNAHDSSVDSSNNGNPQSRKTSTATVAPVPVNNKPHTKGNTSSVTNVSTVFTKNEPSPPPSTVVTDVPLYIIPRLVSRDNTWSIVTNHADTRTITLSANLTIDIPTSLDKETLAITDRLRIRNDYRYVVAFRQSPYVNSNYPALDHKGLTNISIQKQLEMLETKRINASYGVQLTLNKNKNSTKTKDKQQGKVNGANETNNSDGDVNEPVENIWISTANTELSLINTPYTLSLVPFTVGSKDTEETSEPNVSITTDSITADYGRRCELLVLGIPLSFTLTNGTPHDTKTNGKHDSSKSDTVTPLPLIRADNRLPVYVLGTSVPYFTPSTIPEAPTGLGSIKVTKTSIKVKWNLPEERGNMCFKYILETTESLSASKDTEESNFTWRSIYEGSDRGYEHKGLQPGTRYAYRVCGINSNGSGPWSTVFFAWTESSVPTIPSAPLCGLSTPTTMQLNWIPSSDSDIQEYVLEMAEGTPSVDYQTTKRSHGLNFQIVYRGNLTSYTLTNLLPEHTYSLRLTARNQVGSSEPSLIVSYTSPGAVPSQPNKLMIEADYVVKDTEKTDSSVPLPLTHTIHQQYGIPITLYRDVKVSWIGITGTSNPIFPNNGKKGTMVKNSSPNDTSHTEAVTYVLQLNPCTLELTKNSNNTGGKPGTKTAPKDKYTITLGNDTQTYEITDQTWFTFHNLVPSTVYKLRIATKNRIGMSEFTEWLTFMTNGTVPDPIPTLHVECLPSEDAVVSPKAKGLSASSSSLGSHGKTGTPSQPYGRLHKLQVYTVLPTVTHGSDIHEYNVQVRHRADKNRKLLDDHDVQHYLRSAAFMHVQNPSTVMTLDSYDSCLPPSVIEKRSLPVHPSHSLTDTPILLHAPDPELLSVLTSSSSAVSPRATKSLPNTITEVTKSSTVPSVMDKVRVLYRPDDDVDVMYEADHRWYTGKITSIDESLCVIHITLVLGILISLPVITEEELAKHFRKRYSVGQKVSVDLQHNENYRFLGEVKKVHSESYTVTIVGTTATDTTASTSGGGSNEMEVEVPTAQIGDEKDATPSIVAMQLARAVGTSSTTVNKLTNWKDAVLTKNVTKPKSTVAPVTKLNNAHPSNVAVSTADRTAAAETKTTNPVESSSSVPSSSVPLSSSSSPSPLPEWYTSLLPLHSSDTSSSEWIDICTLASQDTSIDIHPLTHLPCTKLTVPFPVFLPGHTYKVRITGKNYYGKSLHHPTVYSVTIPSSVSLPPSFVTVLPSSVTETSMNIQVGVPIDNGGETITAYIVQLADALSTAASNHWKTVYNGTLTIDTATAETVLVHTVNNLLPGRPYYVRVGAVNKNGLSAMRIATTYETTMEPKKLTIAVTRTKGKAPTVLTKVKSTWITPYQFHSLLYNETVNHGMGKLLLGNYQRIHYSTSMMEKPDPLITTVPSLDDILSTWSSVFMIDWSPPTEDYGESIVGYDISAAIIDTVTNEPQNTTFIRVTVRKDDEQDSSLVSEIAHSSSVYQGPVPQILFGAFTPGVSYSIRIRAYNQHHKYGVWSTPLIITAPVDIPFSVSSLTIPSTDGVTHASIRLQWNSLSKQQLGYGNIVAYNVQRIKLPDNAEFSTESSTIIFDRIGDDIVYTFPSLTTLITHLRSDTTNLLPSLTKGCVNSRLTPDNSNTNGTKVSKLLPRTWYGFRMAIENECGSGPYTPWMVVQTHTAPVTVDPVTDNTLMVKPETVSVDTPPIDDSTDKNTTTDGIRQRKTVTKKSTVTNIGKGTEKGTESSSSSTGLSPEPTVPKAPEPPVQVLSHEEFQAHLKEKKRKAQQELKQNMLKKHATVWERYPWLGKTLFSTFVILVLGFIIYGLWVLENSNDPTGNPSLPSSGTHPYPPGSTPTVPMKGPRHGPRK